MSRERLSNFELLRIVAMGLIVVHHYSSVTPWDWDRESETYRPVNELIVNIMSTSGKIGVNLFLMLTGYFLNGKAIKPTSVTRTWIQATMWSYLIFVPATALTTIQHHEYRLALMPITGHGYWFISAYIVAAFCTGWIMVVAKHTTPTQFITGLGSLFTVMSILDWGKEIAFCNIQWFLFAISLGAFMRRYSSFLDQIRTRTVVIMLVLLSVFNWVTVYIFTFHDIQWARDRKGPNALVRENWSILALSFAIVLFLLASRSTIKSNFINSIAERSLGVYLIHENLFIAPRMWRDWVCAFVHKDSSLFPLIAVIQIVLVYFICTTLEYVRQLLFGVFEERISAVVGSSMEAAAEKINNSLNDDDPPVMV